MSIQKWYEMGTTDTNDKYKRRKQQLAMVFIQSTNNNTTFEFYLVMVKGAIVLYAYPY